MPKSLPYLDGTELDYAREGLNEGFKFNNPNVKDACGCGEASVLNVVMDLRCQITSPCSELPRALPPRRARSWMRAYRDIQGQVHPDRFAHAGEAERRLSMQWATHANEAYQTLKNPLERAQYLLQLAGHDRAGGEQYRDAARFPDGADGMAGSGDGGARRRRPPTNSNGCTIACAPTSTAATPNWANCSTSPAISTRRPIVSAA